MHALTMLMAGVGTLTFGGWAWIKVSCWYEDHGSHMAGWREDAMRWR